MVLLPGEGLTGVKGVDGVKGGGGRRRGPQPGAKGLKGGGLEGGRGSTSTPQAKVVSRHATADKSAL